MSGSPFVLRFYAVLCEDILGDIIKKARMVGRGS